MRIGFVGTGAMAGAIARGLQESSAADLTITLQNPDFDLAKPLADELSADIAADLEDLADRCDLIILAVKPNVQESVLRELAPHLSEGAVPAVLSIAAGRTLEQMAANLAEAPIMPSLLRVMPNVNAQVGATMSALACSPETPSNTVELARKIFESIGQVVELPEEQFPIFTALAGCSPAWFFQIVESLALAGVKHGLSKQESVRIVTQSMLGSAKLLQRAAGEGENPSALIEKVCSPGGTTIAGLLAADQAGLSAALVQAVDTAVERDRTVGE